ncbi:hypothetical protein AAG570_004715 [Ranatra chinensis]|uniref:Cell cycle checkpoint protein RAD17 n=1 Tax=Ranatra chinensis TaxID=642074 RepID=A0ABD0YNH9_9HEMI
MASKRRNTFYENKKQEMTEIGDVARPSVLLSEIWFRRVLSGAKEPTIDGRHRLFPMNSLGRKVRCPDMYFTVDFSRECTIDRKWESSVFWPLAVGEYTFNSSLPTRGQIVLPVEVTFVQVVLALNIVFRLNRLSMISSEDSEDEEWEAKCQPRKKQKMEPTTNIRTKPLQDNARKPHEAVEWLDKFAPAKIDDLVVHKKKIEEVRGWLTGLRNNTPGGSRLLVVIGPTGCGKMTTVKIVCKQLKYSVIEWFGSDSQTSELVAFGDFITRATRYNSVFAQGKDFVRVILVKEYPNAFLRDPELFHECLRKYAPMDGVNMVFFLTDPLMARDLFPDNLKFSLRVATISFNSVTQRGVANTLRRIARAVHAGERSVDDVSSMCNGDLRRGILALHFASARVPTSGAAALCAPPSEDHLELFRGLGRVLYAKRDPATSRLVHDPLQVAASFEDCPSLFVDMLRENYLNIYSSLRDVSAASTSLASAEMVLSEWREASLSSQYSMALAALAISVNNTDPVKRFHQMRRCHRPAHFDAPAYRDKIRTAFNTFHERDFLVDVRSYFRSTRVACSENQVLLLSELSFRK